MADITSVATVHNAANLRSAACSQQDVLKSLFELYDRANKDFDYQDGEVDPLSVHYAISATTLGLKCLCSWLEELADYTGQTRNKTLSVDLWGWATQELEKRRLPIILPE